MLHKTGALAVALLILLGNPAHAEPTPTTPTPTPPTPTATDTATDTGAPLVSLRYRYEYVDDDATTFAARASTVRAAVGYRTRSFHGLSATGLFAAVGALGPDFYRVPASPARDNLAYPVVADATGVMVDQVYARYDRSWLTVRVGRQELSFADARVVDSNPWRQVHQTFDAASVDVRPLAGLRVHYALTGRVNGVDGRDASDGQQYLLGHLLDARYDLAGRGSLTAYALRLDYLEDSTRSTATVGVRIAGPWQLDDDWSLLYAAEVARQTDTAHNPNPFAAGHYRAEAGARFRSVSATLAYDVREGSGPLDRFSTPLARPGDGWSERFVDTPDDGLRTMSLSLAGDVPQVPGLSLSAAFSEYRAQTGGARYGQEQDLGLAYRLVGIDRRWTAGSHLSLYQADALFADTVRASVYTAYDL